LVGVGGGGGGGGGEDDFGWEKYVVMEEPDSISQISSDQCNSENRGMKVRYFL
jgi:hypothetical protein